MSPMKTILVVEDTELNIDLVVNCSGRLQHPIARDGEKGVALALEGHPDLNIHGDFPAHHGRLRGDQETPCKLRHDTDHRSLSSCHGRRYAKGDRCRWRTDYLTKPLKDELLFEMLKKYLG